jgi:DNA-binding NarL/FixJ family response regulator
LAGKNTRTAVLLDPHPLWLDALSAILESIDVRVIGAATSPEDALRLVEEGCPDILVCEIEAIDGGMDGSALIRACRKRVSTLRVVVLGGSHDPADIDAAFEAGASAYAVKTAHRDDVAAMVRQIFDHTIFFATSNGHVSNSAAEEIGNGSLTRRELEILGLVAEGHSNRALARMLWVTEQTVKFHLSNIYRKLDVANRTEASAWAHRHGFAGSAR